VDDTTPSSCHKLDPYCERCGCVLEAPGVCDPCRFGSIGVALLARVRFAVVCSWMRPEPSS